MKQDEFEINVNSFDVIETMRSKIYYRVLKLIDAGFVVEAHLLLLTTWNFARFRFVTTSFDLSAYETLLIDVSRQLLPLSQSEFTSVDFQAHQNLISDSFDRIAAIKGIELTGAAKILHLINPHVFVMWDSAISGWHKPKKHYSALQVIRSGFWSPTTYPFVRTGAGYHGFLVYCRERFNGVVSPSPRKTLAKCIDEFNYCSITEPLANLQLSEEENLVDRNG